MNEIETKLLQLTAIGSIRVSYDTTGLRSILRYSSS